MGVAHEVAVLCLCDDIETCETERYVSDVRLALRELQRLKTAIEEAWVTTTRALAVTI